MTRLRLTRSLGAIALALSSSSLATAFPMQLEKAWEFGYQTPGGPTSQARNLVGTADGGVISASTTFPTAMNSSGLMAITKFSENGEREWEFTRSAFLCMSGSCFIQARAMAAVDSAGNVYAVYPAMGTSRLVKLDPQGTALWTVPIASASVPNLLGAHVAVDSQDRPVVGGSTDPGVVPFVAAFKFDGSGNLIWSVGGTDRTETTGMAIGPNDEIALFGRDDYPQFVQNYYGRIHVFDTSGVKLWTGHLSSDGYGTLNFGTFWNDTVEDVVFDDQGGLSAFTNGSFGSEWYHDGWTGFAVARYTASGAQLYRSTIETDQGTAGFRVAVDSAQNVYVTGAEIPAAGPNQSRLSVWKFDPTGALAWQHYDPTALRGTAVATTPAGNLLVTGKQIGVGVDLLLDPFGNVLTRNENPGEFGSPTYTAFARDEVLTDINGQSYTQRQIGGGVQITKYVPGTIVGASYCGPAAQNSTGQSATIDAVGSAAAAAENLTLRIANLPGNSFAMLLNSQTQGSLPMLGGGQGTLCLGGSIGRFTEPAQIRRTRADGTSSLRIDTTAIPNGLGTRPAIAGQTWNFQGWFRDVNPVVTSNLTDAVSVTFL